MSTYSKSFFMVRSRDAPILLLGLVPIPPPILAQPVRGSFFPNLLDSRGSEKPPINLEGKES